MLHFIQLQLPSTRVFMSALSGIRSWNLHSQVQCLRNCPSYTLLVGFSIFTSQEFFFPAYQAPIFAAGTDHIDLHGDLKVIGQVNTVWQGKYNSIINNLCQTMNSLIRPEGTWSKCCVDNIIHNNQDEDKISNRVYWPRIYLCVCIRVSNSQTRNIILLWRNIHPEYPYFNHAI